MIRRRLGLLCGLFYQPVLIPCLSLVFTLVAAGYDLKTREVPDWISLTLLGVAVAGKVLGFQAIGWLSMGAGLVIGFGLGGILFQLKVMGGGDVKLIAALGAALGLPALLVTLLWTTLAGAVLALVSLVRGKQDLAYVPALALGLAIYLACGPGWLN